MWSYWRSRLSALACGPAVRPVLVNEHVAAGRQEQSGARDLGRLIDAVAVGQDRDVTERPELFDDRHRARIQVALERHAEHHAIDVFGPSLIRERAAKASQGFRKIHDARLFTYLFVEGPESRSAIRGNEPCDRALDVLLYAVVIHECVVHVQEEDELRSAMLSRG